MSDVRLFTLFVSPHVNQFVFSCGPEPGAERQRGEASGRGARVVSLLSHSQKKTSQITILHEPRNSQPASLITRAGPHARHTPFAILNSHVLIALSPGDARTTNLRFD